jgi:DNA-binding NarL/FixJ family response regulator
VSEGVGRIRVMVVDDHPMWREAVARDLADAGMDVVGTAGDGMEALRRIPAARPDVVVLDLQMPRQFGVAVTQSIVSGFPSVRVLVLTASGEQSDVLEAVKAGATGYLVKSASREELLAAVTRTSRGEAVFTPGLAGLVLGEFRRLAADARLPDSTESGRDRPGTPAIGGRAEAGTTRAEPGDGDADPPRLTGRETEILRLVAKGLSSRQIAARLNISYRTVQNHTQNILGKLQLHNRVELARYVIERGLDRS